MTRQLPSQLRWCYCLALTFTIHWIIQCLKYGALSVMTDENLLIAPQQPTNSTLRIRKKTKTTVGDLFQTSSFERTSRAFLPDPDLSLVEVMKPYRRYDEAPLFFQDPLPTEEDNLPNIRPLFIQAPFKIHFRKVDENYGQVLNTSSLDISPFLYPLIGDEFLNILLDGWKRSPYFHLKPLNEGSLVPQDRWNQPQHMRPLLKETNNMIWVVDMRRFTPLKDKTLREKDWITTLNALVNLVNETKTWQRRNIKTLQKLPRLQIVLWDWRDRGPLYNFCTMNSHRDVFEKFGELLNLREEPHNLRFVQRCVVKTFWGQRTYLTHPERSIKKCYPYNATNDTKTTIPQLLPPLLQMPYTVRTDYAMAILDQYSKYSGNNSSSSGLFPWTTHRSVDVAHFWNVSIGEQDASMRNQVTEALLEYRNQTRLSNAIIVAHAVSSGGSKGRTGTISAAYVKAMLTAKIIVVAQRDTYEDHYRFFEAMISGAMVLTDRMYTLPEGYQDGVNVVVYNDTTELLELVDFYLVRESERLEIAQRGWLLALQQHSSVAWMERLFYGKVLTPATDVFPPLKTILDRL